jgi:hypothetical protein
MVKRIAAARFVTFVLVVAGAAVSQDLSQSLPDAPSVQAAALAPRFNAFVEQASSPLKFGAMGSLANAKRAAAFSSPENVSRQEKSNTILAKILDPSLPTHRAGDLSSSSGTWAGRATHAASRIFVTRDESGKGRLNTSYFLRALTYAAADTASRPYWRRSPSEPFSAFGSTVGNDAGMNLLHEFGPGIQHLVKSHAPKFVARIITERIAHN